MRELELFSAVKANAGLDFSTPLNKILASQRYVMGTEMLSFETEFANYLGVGHCISVANGSDALELALRGLAVKAGDRVVTAANAGFYASGAIHAVGARPVYIDVDPTTLTLCPNALAAVLDSPVAAIVVTHLYGQLADIEAIVRLASLAGIPVLEDCAQAHGARRNGRLAGSFGAVGCFSFYPTKNLGALGDGGAVVTHSHEMAARMRQLRQYGWGRKYQVTLPGGRNSRMDEIQAAVLRVKLPYLDRWNAQRRSIAKRYNAAFGRFNVRLPCSTAADYVAHLYVIRLADRQQFIHALRRNAIKTDIHYPIPDHRQAAYAAKLPYPLTVTEQACETVVSLPCYPGLTRDEIDRVIASATAYFQQEDRVC
ncbi:DegT/DnrJ/EryC1/StrS family aminotransferase [Martelella alba]|uniref:DegT/DnrJ/EryC1/StrS family aminotransferase n=1 Tax=Martelella alba TaxID=2590451 RepID=A0ABY2SR60_9HYPH|nr:DegT/DnrJ/EryC1/StrS family aminotransferase [Martelella alba]TKI07875.1 DegT/DnrJ/EryC1/StrS family aminotransferase [Martelella alba]